MTYLKQLHSERLLDLSSGHHFNVLDNTKTSCMKFIPGAALAAMVLNIKNEYAFGRVYGINDHTEKKTSTDFLYRLN